MLLVVLCAATGVFGYSWGRQVGEESGRADLSHDITELRRSIWNSALDGDDRYDNGVTGYESEEDEEYSADEVYVEDEEAAAEEAEFQAHLSAEAEQD